MAFGGDRIAGVCALEGGGKPGGMQIFLWKVGGLERRTAVKGAGCLGREGEEEWQIEKRRERMNAQRKEGCDEKKGRGIQRDVVDRRAADWGAVGRGVGKTRDGDS